MTTLLRKVQHFKQHAELYGQTLLVLGKLGWKFFHHELSPPALSSEGCLYSCCKSDLLPRILEASVTRDQAVDEEPIAPDVYGGHGCQWRNTEPCSPWDKRPRQTYTDYFSKVFLPRIQHELKRATRVDIVWDQYHTLTRPQGKTRNRYTTTRVSVG